MRLLRDFRIFSRTCLVCLMACPVLAGCGRQALVTSDALPLKRVVLYRNGVGYFERAGHVEDEEVKFKMRETSVGDFLASLAIMERGGSSVRAASFPLKVDPAEDDQEEPPEKPKKKKTEDEKRGLKVVALALDGRAHDLQVGYITESPVWRPSYRLVVQPRGEADLQAWGIVQNLSGEDWKDVKLSLVAGAPLAFEARLGTPVIPDRPVVTDMGEVIAAMPKGETSLREDAVNGPPAKNKREEAKEVEAERDADLADEVDSPSPARPRASAKPADSKTTKKDASKAGGGRAYGPGAPPAQAAAPAPVTAAPPPPPPPAISAPRNLRSLAAVAAEGGSTRYDLPAVVTVPDKSATMVLLLSRRVPGEALFLFAPDGGVPESANHPFRVARFTNKSGGVLERGPIAVFEERSFLGQGIMDPLPDGASATVPFALERALAIDKDLKSDELGERISKIENSQLTVERDQVTLTKYRVRNGGDKPAKLLVKHPRINGARLAGPPPGTEDNVGTGTALVPFRLNARSTGELTVDERVVTRRFEDWFSPVADNAVKAYLADAKSDKGVVAKLATAWKVRVEVVQKAEARSKLAIEQNNLQVETDETRRNLKAIEKNKAADALRAKLTARLGTVSTRHDELTKQIVEIDAKLSELRVQFKEAIREIVIKPADAAKG
jgi:hypothetical protein